MGRRVSDGGGGKGWPVVGQIGVAPMGNITPRKSGRTSTWSPITREFGKAPKGGKADDGG